MNVNRNYTNKFRNILEAGKMLHDKTPSGMRFIFRIPSLLIHLRCDQWMLVGLEAKSKQRLVIRFTGAELNKNYLALLAYKEQYTETYSGKKWLWQCLKDKDEQQSDLLITEIPLVLKGVFKKEGRFLVPSFVGGDIDISGSIRSIIGENHSLREDVRKMKMNGLSYEMTRESHHLEEFYREMYLPYVNRRWGNLSLMSSYDAIKEHFRKGCLLRIKKGELAIAGCLITYDKEGPALILNGIREGKLEYLKMGALVATYYFSVQYLQNEGYKRLSIGYTRAFLRDGVLLHKKGWGLRVTKPHNNIFLIKPCSETGGIDAFFENNPFICLENNRLCGKLFVKDSKYPDDLSKEMRNDLNVKGLSCFSIQNIRHPGAL